MRKRFSRIVLLFCMVLLMSIPVLATETASEETSVTQDLGGVVAPTVVNKGVSMDGMDLGGLSKEELQTAVDTYVNGVLGKTVAVKIGENETTATLQSLGYVWSNPEVVAEVLATGNTGNIIKRFKDKKDLEKTGKVFEAQFAVDEGTLAAMMASYGTQYNVAHMNPGIVKEGSGFRVVGNAATGVTLDQAASAELTRKFLTEKQYNENTGLVLVVNADAATASLEACERVGDMLGSYTTSFSVSAWARNQNIKNAARLINATVVYPGETFSANAAMSPFTTGNGYYPAGSYENGRVVDSIGGGVCQVSTTLYNAVLRAELEVVERSNHSMSVGYVPLAADAAIAGTWKDLKFRNNTDTPIYIEAIFSASGSLTFNLYGYETRDPARTIQFISETISVTPYGEAITEDPSKPVGYRAVTASGHTGYVAKLWKYVYLNGVQQSVEQVNKSSYSASPALVTVGTGAAAPAPEATTPAPETTTPAPPPETTTPETTTPEI
ncbi:VanW family protein [Parasporobacterium paucivorans]|uniref:Vancomycin resistance protein YoaR, contains peptidoglycan-binding and VanW domains n=1 Tax=Parasporobacterium paucivorans DSM 15970 TaxID=1122934 RepID=A0A1M6CUM3_9FIRM|nr:VanW family protein [Parasporobacterium paucivorans]SHI64727.1 Vancomycin resistance protein YoaR, contains peptidoglycan-binding and VanW domains [Parasporobacterium paucivorans DSM 15970]